MSRFAADLPPRNHQDLEIKEMILLRLLFLFLAVSCEEQRNDDRIGSILIRLGDMERQMKQLMTSVGNIARIEELTSEHVSKLEDRVVEVKKEEGELKEQLASGMEKVKKQLNDVKVEGKEPQSFGDFDLEAHPVLKNLQYNILLYNSISDRI